MKTSKWHAAKEAPAWLRKKPPATTSASILNIIQSFEQLAQISFTNHGISGA
jgi:hypothetical protein